VCVCARACVCVRACVGVMSCMLGMLIVFYVLPRLPCILCLIQKMLTRDQDRRVRLATHRHNHMPRLRKRICQRSFLYRL